MCHRREMSEYLVTVMIFKGENVVQMMGDESFLVSLNLFRSSGSPRGCVGRGFSQ